MNNAKNRISHMRFTKMRADELIADRIDKLNDDLAKAGKHALNDRYVHECELRIEVLNRKINPVQLDSCMTFHGKKVGGQLRDACISESLWLFLHRDSPYGNQS